MNCRLALDAMNPGPIYFFNTARRLPFSGSMVRPTVQTSLSRQAFATPQNIDAITQKEGLKWKRFP